MPSNTPQAMAAEEPTLLEWLDKMGSHVDWAYAPKMREIAAEIRRLQTIVDRVAAAGAGEWSS
jgi:hypothetical protein